MVNHGELEFVVRDGVQVGYRVLEVQGSDEWWLLHPASSCTSSSLMDLAEGLNQRHISAVIMEQRGTGRSTTFDPRLNGRGKSFYSMENLAEDAYFVINEIGLDEVTLFGHSKGFLVMAELASQGVGNSLWGAMASNNFHATQPFPGAHTMYRGARYMIYVGRQIKSMQHRLKGTAMPEYCDQSGLEGKSAAHYWFNFCDQPVEKLRASILASGEGLEWDVASQLKSLDIPVFLVFGYLDWLIGFWREKISDYAPNFAGAKGVYCGHLGPITRPAKVLSAIDDLRKAYKQPGSP